MTRTNVPMPIDDTKPIIVRGEGGRFLKGTVPPKTIKTPEDASRMAKIRWEKATERTASWILKEAKSIDPDVKDEYDAHALMMAKQYTTIIDSDKPRMMDAEKVAQAMGTMARNAELRQAPEQAGLPMPQGDDVIMLIMRRRLSAAEIIDADVTTIRNEIGPDVSNE